MGIVGIRQPEFGQRLRRLRKERGLSQRDVAGSVVNPSYISLLESGARVPTLEVVLHLAQAIGVSAEELAGESVLPRATGEDSASRLVHGLLARSSWDVGDWADAQARHQRAYAAAGDPAAALEHGMALHDVLGLRGEHDARYALLADLADTAAGFGVPELIVKIRVDQATAARDCGRLREALAHAEAAAAELPGTELAGTAEHVRTLGVLLSVTVDSGDTGEVGGLIDSMLALADSLGSPTVLGRSHWAASVAYARLGEPERAHLHIAHAHRMLAHPDTSLRDWGRFARAAASALLDTDSALSDIETYLRWMRAAAELADSPRVREHSTLIEARYALREGDPQRACELTSHLPLHLTTADVVRHHHTHGRALHALGRTAAAIEVLRSAVRLAEEHGNYRMATRIWHDIDRLHSE